MKRLTAGEPLPGLRAELWLIKRLGEHGVKITDGVTTPEIRKQRARRAIQVAKLDQTIVGVIEKKPLTYAQVFQHMYGEPLGVLDPTEELPL